MVVRLLPCALSLFFAWTAILKLWRGGHLCFDPWAPANTVMTPVELLLGWCFWVESKRRFAALLSTSTMLGAEALLTWAHLNGYDVAGCGCFGPVRMPYGAHMTVIGALVLLSMTTLFARRPDPPPPPPRMRLRSE